MHKWDYLLPYETMVANLNVTTHWQVLTLMCDCSGRSLCAAPVDHLGDRCGGVSGGVDIATVAPGVLLLQKTERQEDQPSIKYCKCVSRYS